MSGLQKIHDNRQYLQGGVTVINRVTVQSLLELHVINRVPSDSNAIPVICEEKNCSAARFLWRFSDESGHPFDTPIDSR